MSDIGHLTNIYIMAIFKSILGTISGKSGNLIFSRNKGGQYLKEYKKPTNPKTPLQTAVRQIRSQTSKAWAGLSDDIKNEWNSFAEDNPILNRLGDPIYLSGFGWYQKAGFNYVNIGESLADIEVPNLETIPVMEIDGLACDLLTGIILTLSAAVPATESVIIRSQIYKSGGVTNPGRMKQTFIAEPESVAAIDITTAITALFGTLVVGDFVFIEAAFVQQSSGATGPFLSLPKVVIIDTTA